MKVNNTNDKEDERKSLMIDLHVHTNRSDGELEPKEIIQLAKKEGVKVIAITDHDTTDALVEAREECVRNNIEFIPGIELSSIDNGKEVHILGYYIDETSREFKEFCDKSLEKRNKRNEKYIELLNSLNVNVSIDDIKQVTKSRVISKIHFADCLLKKKYTTYFREAFKKYFNKKNFKDIKAEFPSVEDCIKNIKNAGGIAVLAHPKILNYNSEVLESKIKEYKGYGLSGIECYYTGHSNSEVSLYKELSQKYDLITTGGTDYHGPKVSPVVKIGRGVKGNVNVTDYCMVEDMIDKLNQDILTCK